MSKFLDITGLTQFWGKIKALVNTCVNSVTYSDSTHKLTVGKGDGTLNELDLSRAATAAEADHADLASRAMTADKTDQATHATYAECDRFENDIGDYFISVDLIGNNLWLRRGCGEEAEVEIPSASYDVFTSDTAGLVPAPDDSSGDPYSLLRADGEWISLDDIVVNHARDADSAFTAERDQGNNVIDETYISAVSVSGTTMTFTRPDGSHFEVEIPDTTYDKFIGSSPYDDGTNGLVPSPPATDKALYLRNDGIWEAPGKITIGTVTYDGSADTSFTAAIQTLIDNALQQLINGDEVSY